MDVLGEVNARLLLLGPVFGMQLGTRWCGLSSNGALGRLSLRNRV
jgi:hypothetical protein